MFHTAASTSEEPQATTYLPGSCLSSKRKTVFHNSKNTRSSSDRSALFAKPSLAKLFLLPACLMLYSLAAFVAEAQEELAMSHNNPFVAEPEPEPYYIGQNQPGPTIRCAIAREYRNRSRYELEWLRVVKGNPTTISKNSLLLKKDYDLLESSTEGNYNLRIKYVSLARDNGNFFCRLIDLVDGHQKQSRPAEVVVVVPPEPPTIVEQPEGAVRENDYVTIRCESSSGNPTPKFTWIFDNKTAVPQSWSHERLDLAGGKAFSTIQWHVKSEDNGGYLTCQVWNQAMNASDGSKSTTTNRLNVHYSPRVQVGPLAELSVEEGEPVELNCNVDANPPAKQVEWLHPATVRRQTDEHWRMESVDRRHAGEYICQATNSLDTGTNKLHLNVLYGPKVNVKVVTEDQKAVAAQRINPAELERLVMDCEVDANPVAEHVSWTGPNGFKYNGSRLVINSISKAHIGNFTCTAFNTMTSLYSHQSSTKMKVPSTRSGSSTILVDVKRKPGVAVIITSRTTVDVGQRVQLSCSMGDNDPGSPPAQFRWVTPTSDKEKNLLSTEINIMEAKLEDNGLYKCIPYNEVGTGEEAILKVLVIQPAKLTRTLPSAKLLSAGDVDISLMCEAQGYPAPSMDWYKDGSYISKNNQHWQLFNKDPVGSCEKNEVCPLTVISTLSFIDQVRWSDKGNYSCRANNLAISRPADSSVLRVSVSHEPVVLNQKFPDYALAAANLGTMARISCLVSARPEPRFTWSRNGEEITSKFEPHYSIRDSRLYDRLDEYESVLELNDVSEADFGSYYCQARNGAGGVTAKKANVDIRLQAKSRPQTPITIKVLEALPTWLQIGWKAGFDGGESQTFELEYRAVDPYTGQYNEQDSPTTFVFDGSNTTSQVYYNQEPSIRASRSMDEGEGETFAVHNLTKLRPMSSFWYRVRARNVLGTSEWTAIATAVTLDARESVGEGDLLAPESMLYLPDEQKMIVQPRKANGPHFTYSNHHQQQVVEARPVCLLLYSLSKEEEDGVYRSINCFPTKSASNENKSSSNSTLTIHQIKLADRFKARYCYKHDLSTCSAALEIYVDTASMSHWTTISWKMVFAILVGIISFTLFLLLMLVFCRNKFGSSSSTTSSSNSNGALMKQRRKKVPKRLNLNGGVVVDRIDRINEGHGQLPDTKNTAVHGSQADSGVFTLGSTQNGNGLPNGNPATGAAINGNSTNEHSWPSNSNNNSDQQSDEDQPYDFNTDPYLQELSSQGIVAVENGYPQPEDHLPRRSSQFNPASLRSNNFSHFFSNSQPPQRSSSASSSTGTPGIHVHHPQGQVENGNEETASFNGGGHPRVMREIIV